MRAIGFFVENKMNVLLHHNPTAVVTFECPKCTRVFNGTPRQILDAYREHVYESFHELEDCGCCGCSHFPEFDGDCREDFDRF